ncbi:hypothetical protein ACQY0O_005865 [Thecaphora frezii]
MDFGSVRRRSAATTYARRPRLPLQPESAATKASEDSSSSDISDRETSPSKPRASTSNVYVEPPSNRKKPPQPDPAKTGLVRNDDPIPEPTARPAAAAADGLRPTSPSKLALPRKSSTRSPQKPGPLRPSSSSLLSKPAAKPRVPSRSAKDLDEIFEAHSPRMDDSALSPFNADSSTSFETGAPGPSPRDGAQKAASPLLAGLSLPTLQRPSSPSHSTIPAKRTKLSQRMAPRALKRVLTSEAGTQREGPIGARPLRRTETDPLAGRRLVQGSAADSQSQPNPLTPILSEEVEADAATSTRSLPGSPRRTRQASEGLELDAASRQRRFAALSHAPLTTAKRTYGNHRSFLADRVDGMFGAPIEESQSGQSVSGNIEVKLESQIRGTEQPHVPPTASATSLAFGLQPARESYAELLKKWGDNGDEDIEWDESQDPTLALKSITSLRSAGELRRFNDDLDYLFSGLTPSASISVRRSSAVEFVRLLCGNPDLGLVDEIYTEDADDSAASARSAEFLRKLRAVEGIVRVFDLFREASAGDAVDEVLDVTLTMFLAKVMKRASTAEPLLRERRREMLECVSSMLSRASKSGEDRRDGLVRIRLAETTMAKPLPRSERSALQELRSTAILSGLFLSGSIHPSLKNMILATLCSISTLHKKVASDAMEQMVLPEVGMEEMPTLFGIVMRTYMREGRKSKQRMVDFSKGLELLTHNPFDTWPDLDCAELCIRFIDRCMEMLYVQCASSVAFDVDMLDATVEVLRVSLEVAPLAPGSAAAASGSASDDSKEGKATAERALQLISGVIKLVLDLTQIDADWALGFASSAELVAMLVRTMFLAESAAARRPGGGSSSSSPTKRKPDHFKAAPPTASLEASDKHVQKTSALLDDLLHLSLAALTNLLIKQGGTTRTTLLRLRLHPLCWQRRACGVRCGCDEADRALPLLCALLFRTQRAAAAEGDRDRAYLSNSLATAIAQFAVGGATFLEATQRDADDEYAKLAAGEEVQGRGFTVLLDAVEKFATDMQTDAAGGGEQRSAGEVEGGEGREVVENEEREEANGAVREAGALIKELAGELRSLARR